MLKPLALTEVIAALDGRQVGGDCTFDGVSIDSRAIVPGQLFVALTGPRFDGHDYLDQVAAKGAVGALVERATVEFMANLYGAPGPEVCLNPANDPLGDSPVGPTGGFYPAYANTDTNNGQTRADPSRWHDRRDGDVRRGRY